MKREFIFFRSKPKGHGALYRQELLIEYLIKKNEIINILTLEKEKFPLNFNARVINLSLISFARRIAFLRWILLLISTIFLIENSKSKSFKMVAFSDYQSIIFKLAALIIKLKKTNLRLLFQNDFFDTSPNFEIVFLSRGDYIEIFKVNNPKKNLIHGYLIDLLIFYYKKIQLLAIISSSKCVVQMYFLRDLINKRYNIKKKINVISNNILSSKNNSKLNKSSKQFVNQNFNSKSSITIGFAAPLYIRVKSLDIFINIINELKNNFSIKVVTAGSGVDEFYLTSHLNKIMGFKSYKHLGWVKNIDIFFNKIDILIIPSRYDSCPNFVLEAINIPNIRIIASDIPAHKEIFMKKDFLFPIDNLKKIKNKFKEIISLDNQKYDSYIDDIKKKYTFEWEEKVFKLINN